MPHLFYAWYDPKANAYRLSRMPPDAPVRPSVTFEKRSELLTMAHRKRAEVMWSPPLPPNLPEDLSTPFPSAW